MRRPLPIRLLGLCSIRHWRRHPWSHAALILLMGIGVGGFLSIRLANRAASAGFSLFTDQFGARADLVIRPQSGRLTGSDARVLQNTLDTAPVTALPILETRTGTAADEAPGRRLVGIDLVAAMNLMAPGESDPAEADAGLSPDLMASLWPLVQARTTGVFRLTRTAAQQPGAPPPDSETFFLGGRQRTVPVLGTLPVRDQETAPRDVLFTDLPLLASWMGLSNVVDRFELYWREGALSPDDRAGLIHALRTAGEERWIVSSSDQYKQTGARMSQAFRLNLSALSLLALLVSIYLILQALDAAVVRRRGEIATLRSLGVTPRQIRNAWLMEALFLGFCGSLAGLLLGTLAASVTVEAVTRAVSNLYVQQTARASLFAPAEWGAALGLGLLAGLVAGWIPARDAARTPPAQMLQRRGASLPIRWLDRPLYGAGFLLAGLVFSFLPPVRLAGGSPFPAGGYLASLCACLGLAVLAGLLLKGLSLALVLPTVRRRPALFYGLTQFRVPSGRQKLAAAGIVVATGMAAGIALLVFSFERTVQDWLNDVLDAEVFISATGFENASSRPRIPEPVWREITRDPRVRDWGASQYIPIELDNRSTFLAGIYLTQARLSARDAWIHRPPRGERSLLPAGPGTPRPAVVSESFTYRFDRSVGDRLTLPTPAGPRSVEIVGVFPDYGNERGTLAVHGPALADWFANPRVATLGLYLEDGTESAAFIREWSDRAPGLQIRDQQALRARVFSVFNQTFAVTHALRLIGIGVAMAGLALSLISMLFERRRQLRTLRELGMERTGLSLAAAAEGAGIALVGALGGLALSLVLGSLLIYVINRQAFGWTLAWHLPAGTMAALPAILVPAGALIGALCGWFNTRIPVEQEE